MAVNAMEETFELVTVFGRPMLFTCARIDHDTIPDGYFVYDVRHDDECQGTPTEIAPFILVNHCGMLISQMPIKRITDIFLCQEDSPLIVAENDWNYEGLDMTMEEYGTKYPPKFSSLYDFLDALSMELTEIATDKCEEGDQKDEQHAYQMAWAECFDDLNLPGRGRDDRDGGAGDQGDAGSEEEDR